MTMVSAAVAVVERGQLVSQIEEGLHLFDQQRVLGRKLLEIGGELFIKCLLVLADGLPHADGGRDGLLDRRHFLERGAGLTIADVGVVMPVASPDVAGLLGRDDAKRSIFNNDGLLRAQQ